jgi:hypothetical protein
MKPLEHRRREVLCHRPGFPIALRKKRFASSFSKMESAKSENPLASACNGKTRLGSGFTQGLASGHVNRCSLFP